MRLNIDVAEKKIERKTINSEMSLAKSEIRIFRGR